jgi:proteic killer suppression protein
LGLRDVKEDAAIDISWSSRPLEKSCASDARGRARWGFEHWTVLKRRLASLAAAPTLAEMSGLPGNCHQLHGDRRGQFAMSLRGPYRLIFELDHNPVPELDDGGIDLANITKIIIREVADYHGD